MIDQKTFIKHFGAPFVRAGFIRRGQSWYLTGEDINIVINLQKDWGDGYYVNVGFWFRALGTSDYPRYNHCHCYYRAERLLPKEHEFIRMWLSLPERTLADLAALVTFIETQFIPFLQQCTHEQFLLDLFIAGRLKQGLWG